MSSLTEQGFFLPVSLELAIAVVVCFLPFIASRIQDWRRRRAELRAERTLTVLVGECLSRGLIVEDAQYTIVREGIHFRSRICVTTHAAQQRAA